MSRYMSKVRSSGSATPPRRIFNCAPRWPVPCHRGDFNNIAATCLDATVVEAELKAGQKVVGSTGFVRSIEIYGMWERGGRHEGDIKTKGQELGGELEEQRVRGTGGKHACVEL